MPPDPRETEPTPSGGGRSALARRWSALRSSPALVSLAVAVGVLALKLVAWRVSGSLALLSDAAESLVNVLAGITLVYALRLSASPPDYRHPYGHRKIEDVSGAFEGLLVVAAGAGLALGAVGGLRDPAPLEALGTALWVAAGATVLNGAASLWLDREGRRRESAALRANARHLRTDVWTSLGVFVGVGAVAATGWLRLDPLIALFVAVNILREGLRLVRRSLSQLLDERLPEREEQTILGILRSDPRVRGYHRLRSRRAGSQRFAEFDIFVDPEMRVREAHALADELEDALAAELPGLLATIHVEPEVPGLRQGRTRPREEYGSTE